MAPTEVTCKPGLEFRVTSGPVMATLQTRIFPNEAPWIEEPHRVFSRRFTTNFWS
jgi:hypothetical protein